MNRDEVTEQASEEEQAAYEYLSTQAIDFIHNEKTANFTKNTIGSAKDPLDGIAKVATTILMRLEVQNKENGGIPEEVQLEVAEDIIDELLNLVISNGVIEQADFDQNQDEYVEKIVNATYKYYMEQKEQSGDLNFDEEKSDLVDTVNSQEANQGVNALSNEAAGQLNKMFGGS